MEGLMWFARRHAWHLGLKAAAVIVLLIFLPSFLLAMPGMFMDAAGGKKEVVAQTESLESENEVTVEATVGRVREALPSRPTVPPRSAVSRVSNEEFPPVPAAQPKPVLPEVVKSKRIVMLFEKGVMLEDGTKIRVGETFTFEGSSETLACACAICGVVGFESGKRMRF
jgi:hypothetical protein